MSRHSRLVFLLLLSLAAGCTSVPTGGINSGEGVRQATSMETAVGEPRQRAKIHTELGALYLQNGRFAVALEEARIALAADSNYAPAYNLLGLTHMFLEEPRLAEENFEKALRAAPGDPEINNNFGWFLCQTSREARGLEYLLAAARNPLYSTPAKALTTAGSCSLRLKDEKSAESYFASALRIDPRNAEAYFWMAEMSYRKERFAEAHKWLTDLEKFTDLPANATWLALRVERKLGNRDGEARYAAQLRRKFSGSPEQRKLLQGDYE
jgi:type IV pilus assembly protein PilF